MLKRIVFLLVDDVTVGFFDLAVWGPGDRRDQWRVALPAGDDDAP